MEAFEFKKPWKGLKKLTIKLDLFPGSECSGKQHFVWNETDVSSGFPSIFSSDSVFLPFIFARKDAIIPQPYQILDLCLFPDSEK